jgi:hypothetical protein
MTEGRVTEETSGPSNEQGRDLGTKVALAVFSFLLGLLAMVITNAYLRDRAEIAYSISADPIVSSRENPTGRPDLDAALRSLRNATEFRIRFENVGDLPVRDFAVRLVFNNEAKGAMKSFATLPSREVPWEEDPTAGENELRLKAVTLDRTQALTVKTLMESPVEPNVKIFPFLAKSGVVSWSRGASSESLTLEAALLRLVQLAVLTLVIPGLVVTLPQAIGVFFYGMRSKDDHRFNRTLVAGVTTGQMIGGLIRL